MLKKKKKTLGQRGRWEEPEQLRIQRGAPTSVWALGSGEGL